MTNLRSDEIMSQATSAAAVTPADADLSVPARALWVGGVGNLVLYLLNDAAPTTFAVNSVPFIVPFIVKRVAAATTCTNIVALG